MRRIVWVKAAQKAFLDFPDAVQDTMRAALTIAALGEKADIAKPVRGLGVGVLEIALPYRKVAYRAVLWGASR